MRKLSKFKLPLALFLCQVSVQSHGQPDDGSGVLATVLEQAITESDVQAALAKGRGTKQIAEQDLARVRQSILTRLVLEPVYRQLQQDCQVTVTEQEQADYIDFISKQQRTPFGKDGKTVEQMMTDYFASLPPQRAKLERQQLKSMRQQQAKQQWTNFYIGKCLYNRYGGAVIFQQGNPMEPVGAMAKHLQTLKQKGQLTIYRDEDSRVFWHYFERQHPFQLSKEQIDFSQPWWLSIGEEN